MISEFVDVSLAPKTICFILWDTRTPKTKQENPWNVFKHIIFTNIKISEIENVVIFRKDGHRQILESRLRNSWTSWIWDQYLPESMKWKIGKFCKPINHETKHRETKKPRNQETKRPRDQETKKPRNQDTPVVAYILWKMAWTLKPDLSFSHAKIQQVMTIYVKYHFYNQIGFVKCSVGHQ